MWQVLGEGLMTVNLNELSFLMFNEGCQRLFIFLLPTPQFHISMDEKTNHELIIVTTNKQKLIFVGLTALCPSLNIWCITRLR